jgi:probable addiction module antidote protein
MASRTKEYRPWLLGKLGNPGLAAAYLNEAMADSPEMFLKALRNVAQAQEMAKVAKKAGVRRESLYRTLSKNGNPRLNTLSSILQVVGLRISIQPKSRPSKKRAANATARPI